MSVKRIAALWFCPEKDFGALLELVGKPFTDGSGFAREHREYERQVSLLADHAIGQGAEEVYFVIAGLEDIRKRVESAGLDFGPEAWAAVAAKLVQDSGLKKTLGLTLVGPESSGKTRYPNNKIGWALVREPCSPVNAKIELIRKI